MVKKQKIQHTGLSSGMFPDDSSEDFIIQTMNWNSTDVIQGNHAYDPIDTDCLHETQRSLIKENTSALSKLKPSPKRPQKRLSLKEQSKKSKKKTVHNSNVKAYEYFEKFIMPELGEIPKLELIENAPPFEPDTSNTNLRRKLPLGRGTKSPKRSAAINRKNNFQDDIVECIILWHLTGGRLPRPIELLNIRLGHSPKKKRPLHKACEVADSWLFSDGPEIDYRIYFGEAFSEKISNDPIYKSLAVDDNPCKDFSYTFKQKDFVKAKKVKRTPIQNIAIAAEDAEIKNIPANKCAQLYQLRYRNNVVICEWTHLAGFQFIRNAGQIPQNIILAPKTLNSFMLVFENTLAKVIKATSDPECDFTISGHIDPIEGYKHTARRIYYKIKSVKLDLDLNFEFDAFSSYIPENNLEDHVLMVFIKELLKNGSKSSKQNIEIAKSLFRKLPEKIYFDILLKNIDLAINEKNISKDYNPFSFFDKENLKPNTQSNKKNTDKFKNNMDFSRK